MGSVQVEFGHCLTLDVIGLVFLFSVPNFAEISSQKQSGQPVFYNTPMKQHSLVLKTPVRVTVPPDLADISKYLKTAFKVTHIPDSKN